MAALQSSSHAHGVRKKRRLNAEMNVVPYIDVMLVLLTIFMITAPMLTQGIEVELPEAKAEAIDSQDEPVTLSIDAAGDMYMDVGDDTKRALDDDDVLHLASSLVRNRPNLMILVKADAQVPYQYVAHGMSVLQAAGVAKIGFVTEPPASKSR